MTCYDVVQEGLEDGKIDKEGFISLLQNPEAMEAIEKFGTDVSGLKDLSDVFFDADTSSQGKSGSAAGSLSFEELLNVIKRLRRENNAKVSDVSEMRKFVAIGLDELSDRLDKIANRIDAS